MTRSTLDRYHLLHSVRGDLLSQLGRHAEAHAEFELAASLARNDQERRLSRERADAMARLAEGLGLPLTDRDVPGSRRS